MPNFVGLTLKQARAIAGKYNWTVSESAQQFTPQPKGTIQVQVPGPGFHMIEGGQVNVVTSTGCDPNYTGCLDPTAYDYDCINGTGDGPKYTGFVRVIGIDHYGLDGDGNGYGCE